MTNFTDGIVKAISYLSSDDVPWRSMKNVFFPKIFAFMKFEQIECDIIKRPFLGKSLEFYSCEGNREVVKPTCKY